MTTRTDAKAGWRPLAGAALLALGVFAVYWPALHGGFLFDDDSLLTSSPFVKSANGLARLWFTTEPIDYWPLTNTTFWVEWRLWGESPTGYHITNLLLHTGAAVLLWRVLRRLAVPGAWLAAAIFAIHPVNVQSVAWIAQRKNVLSMVWYLASILLYLRDESVRSPRAITRFYWFSLLAFVLALLSKGSVAMLPGALLLLAWWRRGTVNRSDLLRVAPFLAVAVAMTAVNVWFQMRMPGGTRDVALLERALGAPAVVWFYLSKALVPWPLLFMYQQWSVHAADPRWWLPAAAAVLATVALWRVRAHPAGRAALLIWVYVVLALVPVMGLTDVYFMIYSLVADHYQYLAMIGVAAGLAACVASIGRRRRLGQAWSAGRSTVAAGLLTVLGALTWQQSGLYADAEILYRETLARNPSAWVLHNNLGALLYERGRYEESAVELREALRLHPGFVKAHNNLCQAAARLQRMDEALDECRAALSIDRNLFAAQNSLGLALASKGRLWEARAAFEAALAIRPEYVEAHYNLADVLLAIGEPRAAADQYRHVLRLWPEAIGALTGLGHALEEQGDATGAERAYRAAAARQPDAADPHRSLGALLLEQGRIDEAIREYELALSRDPRSADTHNNLGVALVRAGRRDEAVGHFQTALTLDPSLADARANLERIRRQP